MKKTIISIIGIAVMLLAITACRPNYVIVPIPGGGTSSTPSGTPVSDAGELKQALEKGEDVYLTDLIRSLPLENSTEQWIEAITKAGRNHPEKYRKEMYGLGFDIHEMVKRIYAIYQ